MLLSQTPDKEYGCCSNQFPSREAAIYEGVTCGHCQLETFHREVYMCFLSYRRVILAGWLDCSHLAVLSCWGVILRYDYWPAPPRRSAGTAISEGPSSLAWITLGFLYAFWETVTPGKKRRDMMNGSKYFLLSILYNYSYDIIHYCL